MFTGKLGTSDSRLGNFKLAAIATGGGSTSYDNSISIDGTASITVSGGTLLSNNFEIINQASVTILPGTGYTASISIDAVDSLAATFVYLKNESISIGAVVSLTATQDPFLSGSITVAGQASASVASIQDYVITQLIPARGFINVEQFFNVLLDAVVINTITISNSERAVNTENPVSSGSMSVSAQAIYRRNINQTLTLRQHAQLPLGVKHVTQSYNVTQSVTRHTTRNLHISQVLNYTQESYRVFPTGNSLSLIQVVSFFKVFNKSIHQTLHITQNQFKNTNYNLHIIQNYRPFHNKLSPVSIFTDNGIHTIYVPSAYVSIIPQKCYVLLQNTHATLILPCPQLGDSENNLGNISLKRTITGDTLTYVRKSNLRKLNYTFWLGRLKTIEVENFIINHSDKVHRLFNWKGEEWIVKFTNTPFQFTGKERYQPQGERYEVTFEFTGTKIGG